ncbi:hypothetical protein ACFZB9_22540 [Kitasatospora sp. NPDC008050]|uniref:hypothetical protein n=1 Tax=Kitasatospora sp. NPDC008050 TaxID=3364021 RepID=UPI0036E7C433
MSGGTRSMAGRRMSCAASGARSNTDQGFEKTVVDHGAGLGIAVETVERNPVDRGFVPQPIRWRGGSFEVRDASGMGEHRPGRRGADVSPQR